MRVLLLAALILAARPAAAAWTVFCINGRTQVDARNVDVLGFERGRVCARSPRFSSPEAALAYANGTLGGVGSFCSCRF